MSDIAIRVDGLGKAYQITRGSTRSRYRTLQEDLIGLVRRPFSRADAPRRETFWALKDISFEVKHGEVLGIIGRNGAGKSTLLKILSRITKPTVGRADLYGRVGSLLEVGTGFHPELTGRENVFLNGTILGMTRGDIQRRFDEIVAFAEVEQFLDTPVKRYSSGMYMRLAFAVAAHLEPEILVVDEVLAVGDAKFQEKCLGKMNEVAKQGRTVLFVSHNMAAVERLCHYGLVLESGCVKFTGNTHRAIDHYLESYSKSLAKLEKREDRIGSGEIVVAEILVRDSNQNIVDTVKSGQDIQIVFRYTGRQGYYNPRLRFSILVKTVTDAPVFLHHNRLTRETFEALTDSGAFVCSIQRLPLTAGTYRLTYSIMIGEESYIDYLEHAAELTVVEGDYYGSGEVPPSGFGPMLVQASWSTETTSRGEIR
jgi:lipopolysaccharide transport system ATP-binding protein